MTEVQRILDLVQRAYTGDAWHGLSLGELVEHIDPEIAMAQLVPGVHTMLELVRHITVWQDAVLLRLSGEVYDVPEELNWQPDIHESAWGEALFHLEESRRDLEEKIVSLGDDDLWSLVPGKPYTNYVMLHGLVQHTLYHTGQIAMLASFARQMGY